MTSLTDYLNQVAGAERTEVKQALAGLVGTVVPPLGDGADYSRNDLVADFLNGRAWEGPRKSSASLYDWFMPTRAGTSATKRPRHTSGAAEPFPAGTLARTNKGLSIERASANLVANAEPSNLGTPGSPGTMPAGWSAGLAGGLSRQYIGNFVENGLRVYRYRIFGTATGNVSGISAGGNSGISPSTLYAAAVHARIVEVAAGAVMGATYGIGWYTSASVYVSGVDMAFALGAADTPIGKCMSSFKMTSPATAGVVVPGVYFKHNLGAVDFTVDIAMPIVEAGLPLSQPFTGTRAIDSVAIGGSLLDSLKASAGTLVLALNSLPIDAVDAQILSINNDTSLLKRDASGAISTAWGGVQATAALPLQYWGGRMQVGISWNPARVVIGASGAPSVGANNAPAAVTSALLGSLSTVALCGFVERMTFSPQFMDVA